MKILIAGLKENIQFTRLSEEGAKRGHSVDGCLSTELVLLGDKDNFKPTLRGKDLTGYDLIYLMVSKRRWEWYTAALYLHQKQGTVIVNGKVVDPTYNFYLTPAIDYLRQTENGLNYPKSAVIYSAKSLDCLLKDFSFPVIIKTSAGRQGKGVYKAESREQLFSIVSKMGKDEEVPSIVIREFIPNDGDVRVFTVGYKAIGAMKRTPKEGDFRSNISQGGSGAVFELDAYPKVKELAEKAAEITRTEVAGVDIIINKETEAPYILEINPGPQFEGLEKFTKVNAALEIIKYFESLYNKPQ
jgi:RimK family alpha-L-glutamate ligase